MPFSDVCGFEAIVLDEPEKAATSRADCLAPIVIDVGSEDDDSPAAIASASGSPVSVDHPVRCECASCADDSVPISDTESLDGSPYPVAEARRYHVPMVRGSALRAIEICEATDVFLASLPLSIRAGDADHLVTQFGYVSRQRLRHGLCDAPLKKPGRPAELSPEGALMLALIAATQLRAADAPSRREVFEKLGEQPIVQALFADHREVLGPRLKAVPSEPTILARLAAVTRYLCAHAKKPKDPLLELVTILDATLRAPAQRPKKRARDEPSASPVPVVVKAARTEERRYVSGPNAKRWRKDSDEPSWHWSHASEASSSGEDSSDESFDAERDDSERSSDHEMLVKERDIRAEQEESDACSDASSSADGSHYGVSSDDWSD